MAKEDKYIENQFGRVQPLKASQGYLDNFTDQFMIQLPDQAAKTVETRHATLFKMCPTAIAVIGVLAVATTAAAYFAKPFAGQREQTPTINQRTKSSLSDGSVEEAASYLMIDNGDIYTVLADK